MSKVVQKLFKAFDFRHQPAINFCLQGFEKISDLPEDGQERQLAYAEGAPYYHNGERWTPFGTGSSSTENLIWNSESTPSTTWDIVHNCGQLVTVQTMDEEGNRIDGSVRWDLDDLNHITVTFSTPVKGRAIISCNKLGIGSYEFTEEDVWVINHGLHRYPMVQTIDEEGDRIDGSVKWISEDMVEIRFSGPTTGIALLV